MSRLISSLALGALVIVIALYAAAVIAANTSITQRSIHTEVEIDAPASTVWQVLTDFEAYPEWNPFIRQINGTAATGDQLTVKMVAGKTAVTFSPTVLAVQPERELRWKGILLMPGIFDGEHAFVIEVLGENKVKMTQKELFNGLLVPLSGSLLDDTEAGFRAMNQALKSRAEDMAGRSG